MVKRIRSSRDREEMTVRLLATLVGLGILAVCVMVGYWVQTQAPCWVFSLKDAPVRCVVQR